MNHTLHQTPFLRFLVPFILGIAFQYCTGCVWVAGWSCVLSVGFFILHLTKKNVFGNRWFFGAFVTLLCFSGGLLLMHHSFQQTEWEWGNEDMNCSGVLTEYPVEKKKTVMCTCHLSTVDRQVIVYLPKDSTSLALLPGDNLSFRCRFTPLEKSTEKVDFDYAWYLKKKGFAATGFVRKNQWLRTSHTFAWRYEALRYRTSLIAAMNTMGLSKKSFALNVAMTFGYKNLMDDDVSRSFTASGVSHLVAISGLHVQLIYMMLYVVLTFLGDSRRDRIVRCSIILPVIWGFTFVTGLSPSLVRAALMISLYGLGEVLFRRSQTLNVVYASAALMLLYEPLYLFDVGFQLSYAAVLSIIIIYPMFDHLHVTFNPLVRYLWSSFGISIAAQLGTAPLCLYYFHQFPIYFWIANMVIVPLSAPLLIGTLIATGVQLAVFLPHWVYSPLEWILQASMFTAKAVEELPFSVLHGFYPDEVQTALFYAMLAAAIAFFKNKNVRNIYIFQLFALLEVIYYL